MCGIVGVFAYHSAAPPVDRSELRVIRDHMFARGPDGSGEWYSDNNAVGLGHRRLSVIDLSDAAAQPMSSADGKLVISFNGEIYNYRELRVDLVAKGHVFHTASDTEVLLHLYAEKGVAMLQDLRGMFAFAIWDERKQALLLARDVFGIKPLYYSDNGKTFRFASQVKALLAGGGIDTTPQPAGHAGFFLWGSVPEPWTLYQGIRSLMAGNRMWVDGRGIGETAPFNSVRDILYHAAAQPAQGTLTDSLVAISEAVNDSVSAHHVSDVPVGVFLSSGLDSAIIATLATRDGSRPNSLTLGFAEYAGTSDDEAPMAEMLAAHLGTRHATLMVGRKDFEEDRSDVLAAMDQPSIDGVNTWFVARAAASQNIKVALSGLGGDELFASYPSFSDIPRITRIARLLSVIPGFGRQLRKVSLPLIARITSPKFAGLFEYGGTLGGAYLLRRGLFMPWELPYVLDPELARLGWRDLKSCLSLEELCSGVGNERLAISALEMSVYMRHQLLRDADWAGMAHSVEIRVPFVDTRLLEAVAPWIATHDRVTKREVAAAITSQLAPSFLRKPKTGFSVPLRDWMIVQEPTQKDRGFRGWARLIHHHFTGMSL